MVGAGAAAARRWSDCEKMLHVQEQMRSPKKMVGGAESRLESNPVPTRNAQKAQTKLVRTRDPTETEPELSERLLRRCGSAGACRRAGAQVQETWVWQRPLGGGRHQPHPRAAGTSTGLGNRLLAGTKRTLCAPGPRRKEQWPHKRLSQTCL